jgi:L-ascorbate metabolism protein UlaG (beta-lactamase superfamily)
MIARTLRALATASLLVVASCRFPATITWPTLSALFSTPAVVPDKITRPVRKDARLAVLWVGHATVLLQMDDKIILTDPVFTSTIGQVSRRLVEPGIDVENVPAVDVALISHLHFDHLSLGSLSLLERKIGTLIVPQKGLVYVPDYPFESIELPTWSTWESGGLRVTAVPVRHAGFRYGIDRDWMKTSFTGYVVEYHGLTVYFGGDTAYDHGNIVATVARFPAIDLALLPIAPIHPRAHMDDRHVDPEEATRIFQELGARFFVPIHFGTFINSEDAPGEPLAALRVAATTHKLAVGALHVLTQGEQQVLVARPRVESATRKAAETPLATPREEAPRAR